MKGGGVFEAGRYRDRDGSGADVRRLSLTKDGLSVCIGQRGVPDNPSGVGTEPTNSPVGIEICVGFAGWNLYGESPQKIKICIKIN